MFHCTICDPLVATVIDRGTIAPDAVLPAFRDFPWAEMLAKMRTAKESDIHFSPSIEFTNTADGHGLTISIVEDKNETVFYLFYKESAEEDAKDLLDQSPEATVAVLEALVAGDYDRIQALFTPPKRGWKFWK